MATLANRVQNALDEARILVLGAQILLGFDLRAFFEPGFAQLPEWARTVKLASACIMCVALVLVILPTPFHRLAEGGEDSERMHRVATRATSLALAPLALGLGLDLLLAGVRVADVGVAAALAAGVAVTAVAALLWYAIPAWRHRPRRQEDDMQRSDVDKRIRHVLTEARMVLPGAQAMLGLQLSVTLMEAFHELPRAAQLVHAGALLLTALAIVLLIAPAAYHRIAEEGEETERFHRIASGFVVASLLPLAISMSAELAVAAYRLTHGPGRAALLGGVALAVVLGAWFGFALCARALRRGRGALPARSLS